VRNLKEIARRWLPADQKYELRVLPSAPIGRTNGSPGYAWRTTFSHDRWTGQRTVVGKELIVPEPDCLEGLYVWLHECGHARMRHHVREIPTYVKEYEAEDFAHTVFAEEGLVVPEWMSENGRLNVLHNMRHEGIAPPDVEARVRRWIESGSRFRGEERAR
jgi:hypothetical protein